MAITRARRQTSETAVATCNSLMLLAVIVTAAAAAASVALFLYSPHTAWSVLGRASGSSGFPPTVEQGSQDQVANILSASAIDNADAQPLSGFPHQEWEQLQAVDLAGSDPSSHATAGYVDDVASSSWPHGSSSPGTEHHQHDQPEELPDAPAGAATDWQAHYSGVMHDLGIASEGQQDAATDASYAAAEELPPDAVLLEAPVLPEGPPQGWEYQQLEYEDTWAAGSAPELGEVAITPEQLPPTQGSYTSLIDLPQDTYTAPEEAHDNSYLQGVENSHDAVIAPEEAGAFEDVGMLQDVEHQPAEEQAGVEEGYPAQPEGVVEEGVANTAEEEVFNDDSAEAAAVASGNSFMKPSQAVLHDLHTRASMLANHTAAACRAALQSASAAASTSAAAVQAWVSSTRAWCSSLWHHTSLAISAWLSAVHKLAAKQQLPVMPAEHITPAAASSDWVGEDRVIELCSLQDALSSRNYMNSSATPEINDINTALESIMHLHTLDQLSPNPIADAAATDGSHLMPDATVDLSPGEFEDLGDVSGLQAPALSQVQEEDTWSDSHLDDPTVDAAAVAGTGDLAPEDPAAMCQDSLDHSSDELLEVPQDGVAVSAEAEPDTAAESLGGSLDAQQGHSEVAPASTDLTGSEHEAPTGSLAADSNDDSGTTVPDSTLAENTWTDMRAGRRAPTVLSRAGYTASLSHLVSNSSTASLVAASLGLLASILAGLSAALALALVHARAGQQAAARALKHASAEHARAIGAIETAHSDWQAAVQEAHASDLARLEAAGSVALATLSQQHSKAITAAHAAAAAQAAMLNKTHAAEVSALCTQLAQARKALRNLQTSSFSTVKANISVQRLLQSGILSAVSQLKEADSHLHKLEAQLQAAKEAAAVQREQAATQLLRAEKKHAQETVRLVSAHAAALASLQADAQTRVEQERQAASRAAAAGAHKQARLVKAWAALREHHKVLVEHLEARAELRALEHQAAIQALEHSLAAQHAATLALNDQLEGVREEVLAKEEVVADLHAVLEERMAEISLLELELSRKDTLVSQKVALMEQLQGTLQGVEEKVAQEEEVSRGLTRRLEEAQAQVEERESEAAALREEMAGMAEQLKQIPVFEAKMAEAVSALQDLTAKGLAGERQLQVLHQELETARQECEHTKEELRAAKAAAAAREAELQAQVEAKEREIKKQAEAKDKEARLRLGDIQLLKAEAAKLEAEVKGLRVKGRSPLPSSGPVLAALSTNVSPLGTIGGHHHHYQSTPQLTQLNAAQSASSSGNAANSSGNPTTPVNGHVSGAIVR